MSERLTTAERDVLLELEKGCAIVLSYSDATYRVTSTWIPIAADVVYGLLRKQFIYCQHLNYIRITAAGRAALGHRDLVSEFFDRRVA
jgi:hypothetical protein